MFNTGPSSLLYGSTGEGIGLTPKLLGWMNIIVIQRSCYLSLLQLALGRTKDQRCHLVSPYGYPSLPS
jgi:hypothetical protein